MARRFKPRRNLRKKRATTKPKVSLAVKQYVKRYIHGQTENKIWVSYAANQAITTASGSYPTALSLVPQVAQGTTQFTRIGNKIKVVKGFIRGHVNLLPYNATSNPWIGPLYVKMWLCKYKKVNSGTVADTNIDGFFFDSASGGTGFQGNMLDMELTNNKDSWIVYKTKTFELNQTATIGVTSGTSAPDNSKYSMPFYFSFGRHIRRQINYEATVAGAPNNANLFLVFQVVNADGSATAVQAAEYHFNTRVEYEDA